jgi:hypothetical protein
MKFIAKSMLILAVIALVIGGVAYNLMSVNVKQSGTINLAQQNLAKESRPVTNDIEQVEMNGPFDLAIIRADQASLDIQGEERLLPKVVVQQDGKILRISTKGMLVTMNQMVKITLTIPKLTSLTQYGSGDSAVTGFTGTELNFNLNGSGDLSFSGQYQHLGMQIKGSGNTELDIANADQIEINSGGSGEVTVIGKVNKLSAVTTGSGNIDAQRLISQQSEAISHGSGNIKIYANKVANLTLTGTGDIEIYGNPATKNVTNTGTGEVSSN